MATLSLMCSCQPAGGDAAFPIGRNRAEWSAVADIDERFTAYVRDRGEHYLRVAVLLTGDWVLTAAVVAVTVAVRAHHPSRPHCGLAVSSSRTAHTFG